VHSSVPLVQIINNRHHISGNTKSGPIIPEISTVLSFNTAHTTSIAIYPFLVIVVFTGIFGMFDLVKYLVCGLKKKM
jgi:hypothetical protein